MFEHIETKLKDMVTEDSETGRVYKTPEGIDLPSITTVLSILSVSMYCCLEKTCW